MAENESVITAANLTKTFRDFWMREKVTAVADLDLRVEPREVFGLLGPNGSGKSTTIKMILGLLFPTKGKIAVYGRHPTDVAVKARIGFLPEESYLYPFLDARETLDFYGRLFHQPRAERLRRIEMLLDMVGLTNVAYRRVGEYSKGMQRRIGLAQALINDPDLLILDEPTSGMDPIGTRQFKDLIRTLAQRGKTVVLSSHLLADVEDVCDRVCILYGGKRRAQGRMDDLLAKNTQVQLTTDSLDERTLDAIRKVLQTAGKTLLDVSTPKDRLESLFLRIVKEAQEQKLTTGGALAGGAVAQFLQVDGLDMSAGSPGRDVLEELISAAQPIEPTKPAEPSEAPIEVAATASAIIDDLVAGSTEPAEAKPAKPAKPQPAPQANRAVIDDLLKNDDGADDKESQ